MMLDRRAFHQQLAATALGLAGGAAIGWPAVAEEPQKAKEQPLPIVDTHQHLWDLKKFELAWLGTAPEVLSKSYLPADYAEATAGLNIVRAVYMEVDVIPTQQQAEADYILAHCASKGSITAGAVISGRPEQAEQFEKYIRQFADNRRIKGVRQVLHSPTAEQGLCLRKPFVQSIQLLGTLGKRFDLCMRPNELGDAAALVKQCPDTQFILDHCGNADPAAFFAPAALAKAEPKHTAEEWKKGIDAVAAQPNTVCKISGIVAGAPEKWDAEMLAPPINYCLDAFGPDRVIFGGDWPVCLLRASYRQWVTALLSIISNRPATEQKKLLHDNAIKLYGII